MEGTQDDETTTGGVTYNEYALGNAWTAIGGDYDPTPVDTLTIPSLTPGWYQWDVIAAAADWISGVETNDGFFLRASGGSVDKISFTSGDGASAASWPRLTIDYNCPCGAACPADPLAPSTVILSTMSQATLGGLTFSDKDLAEYDKDADTATLYLDGSVVGVTQDIDALHVLANGHLVLSTIGTETLGGTTFDNEDLVDYDPIADIATVLFDGSAAFTAGSTDVSAVHVTANRHLVLSNEYAATLGGLSFEPNDLIDYDPVTDTATLLLDGDAVGLLGRIDAVHLLDDGHLVLSTNAPASLGGLSFTEGDLVEYDPVGDTASLFLDGALFTAAENVRSAHVGAGSGEITFSEPSLWLSTLDDVASSGAPGLDSWTGGEVIAIASPSFALEPGATDGTFSSILNLDDFAADSDADIDAIHYVGSDITVGSANSVALLSGDVLLSTVSDETLTSTNSLAVNDEDVFAFRPDVAGDYGAGTFIFLIDGSQIHGANTVGVSLVEENTTVGDGSLTKASFIMAITGRRDVIEFTADDVGAGTTTGSFTEFIDGAAWISTARSAVSIWLRRRLPSAVTPSRPAPYWQPWTMAPMTSETTSFPPTAPMSSISPSPRSVRPRSRTPPCCSKASTSVWTRRKSTSRRSRSRSRRHRDSARHPRPATARSPTTSKRVTTPAAPAPSRGRRAGSRSTRAMAPPAATSRWSTAATALW